MVQLTFVQPLAVGPGVGACCLYDGGEARPLFHFMAKGVGFFRQQLTILIVQLIFIQGSFGNARYKQPPDTVIGTGHGVAAAIPPVKITDHADGTSVGGIDLEQYT